jgi:tRNA isopentenyl-2-thiomethyl-A-37 hydroxylase MiaE
MKNKGTDKLVHDLIINGVINAKSSSDLKKLLDLHKDTDWYDGTRATFLLGLLQGSLLHYNRDVAVHELRTMFLEM